MTVGGLVDTVFRFNRLCECHLYTAPRNKCYSSTKEGRLLNSLIGEPQNAIPVQEVGSKGLG